MEPRRRKDAASRVFVDTVAWIALFNQRDNLHLDCRRLRDALKRQKTRFVTSEFVLLEFADGCGSLPLRAKAISFLNGIKRLPELKIVPLSTELLAQAWDLILIDSIKIGASLTAPVSPSGLRE
jgi:predicted nucleic acid-binding protein